ncbi:MAG: (2Fe-2S) ferredoxin domain-containing protein [Cyanobacteria bacterium P01_H01_bin.15]
MPNSRSASTWMFNLEGTCRGFIGKDLCNPKSLVLEVEQEEVAIKLAKNLRSTVRRYVHLGDRIRCLGYSQVDLKSGIVKLKANQLFSLPQHSFERSVAILPPSTPAIPNCLPQQQAEFPSLTEKPRNAKILVCKKSGCQKRGGQHVVNALEQILHENKIHERVSIHYTGCQKRCSKSPSLTIMPGKHRYDQVRLNNLPALVIEHFCTSELNSANDRVEN